MKGKSSFYNNINFLKEEVRDAINELNGRQLLSDVEAEDIIKEAILNRTNWREDLSERQEKIVKEIRKDLSILEEE